MSFAEEYLAEPSFAIMMRPSTFRRIVRFANPSEAVFLMPRSPTLFGIPVRFTSAMPAVAANTFPIVAGCWKRGYSLVSRGNLSIIFDNITAPGSLKWHGQIRYGATVRNNDALKLFKAATS